MKMHKRLYAKISSKLNKIGTPDDDTEKRLKGNLAFGYMVI
jgi:hypothetical protein